MRQLTHQPAQPPASTAPRPDRSDRGPIGLSGVPYEFRSFLKFSKFVEKQIIIGMSGHIDHGKTSIVKALTGKDTDVLNQEKEREPIREQDNKHLHHQHRLLPVSPVPQGGSW